MKTRLASLLTAAALVACTGATASAQCYTPQKLQRVGADPNDLFGQSVALDQGETSVRCIIGIPNYNTPQGQNAGTFSVWGVGGQGWVSVGGAWDGTGSANARLGWSVDMCDPYVIAGAPGHQNNRGKAVVFRRDGTSNWVSEGSLNSGLGNSGDEAGTSVAVSAYAGGWAVMGAPFHSMHSVSQAGAAFFFTRAANGTWSPAFQIWGGDFGGDVGEHRGTSVAMSKTSRWAAVGGPNATYTNQPSQSGVVYMVQRLDNGLVGAPSVLVSPNSQADAHFGSAVAVEGNVLVVGAPDQDLTFLENFPNGARTDAGRVFVFEYDADTFSWVLAAQLRADQPTSGMRLGAKVSTDGTRIAATAAGTGHVYVFEKLNGTWAQTSRLADPDSAGSFGNSIAVFQNFVLVGDSADSEGNIASRGAAYATRILGNKGSDTCYDAPPLPTSEFSVCTTYATPSSPANATTCGTGGSGQGPDIWYSFTPTCSGNAIIDTFGSDFDTVLSVHTGCPGLAGNQTLVCNDDHTFPAPNNRASLVTFNFVRGQTYYVRITGYNGASGNANVRPSFYYQHPNDACSTALNVGYGAHAFDSCSATNGITASPCTASIFNDIWFNFTAPATERVRIDTCGTSFDTIMVVYPGSPAACPSSAGTALACNDDSPCGLQSMLEFDAVAGQSYRIQVGGYTSNARGMGTLTIGPVVTCDPDVNCDGNVDQDDIACLAQAIAGNRACICIDPDFNGDGNLDQDDIAALAQVVAGSACP